MEDTEDDLDLGPEQFSEQSRTALTTAVEDLVEALRRHAEHVGGLRGGSSEIAGIFEANAELETLIDAWNERVADHTGTFPVALLGRGGDEDEDGDDGGDFAEVVDGDPISVVSRWDLQIVEVAALVRAGREAHRRLRPDETEDDAAVAVPGPGPALYALLHEAGEPWYDLPGVEVIRGARAYVRPEEAVLPLADEEDVETMIVEPAGERLYGETWA